MRRPFLRVLQIVAIGCAVMIVTNGCEREPPPEGKRIGNRCPEIAGVDVDGNAVRLSDYKGKVVLVNFWGTWCGPCRTMIPHEREMVQTKYAGRPFVILGVAIDSPDRLKAFLKSNPLPWPNIADGNPGTIAGQWHIDGVPSAILVDPAGVIVQSWFDGIDPDDVWLEVERAVRAAQS